MPVASCRLLATALVLLLAGCGGLPRPFAGNPGAAGALLSRPPPARLAVIPPTGALLTSLGADTLAGALAEALVRQEIPAVAERTSPGDWRLVLTAELKDSQVVPYFSVENPSGRSMGISAGAAVDPAAWADAKPQVLRAVAEAAAPNIATLLSRIEAARLQSDPNSLVNRPAKIFVKGVTGATGDGNAALARQLRLFLPENNEKVQDVPLGADYTVEAKVAVGPGAGTTDRVEIQWIVTDAAGEERGRIIQLNEVPQGTVAKLWGDVAVVAAKEAAGGVKDVIRNQLTARR